MARVPINEESEQKVIQLALDIVNALAKPTMVLRFAHADKRPGGHTRALNAAREILAQIDADWMVPSA